MGSRVRSSPAHVFECFCEVAIPKSVDEQPFVLQKFPETYDDAEVLKSVPHFSYPCDFVNQNVLHFSFVLTSLDSKWTFGFCRHSPSPANTCIVLLSSLPWHDTFYRLLNEIASLTNKQDALFLSKFLEAMYDLPVPEPGLQLHFEYFVNARKFEFQATCPDHHKIPTIPEDRNLTEYFNAIDSTVMMTIFASMLNERRIIITSKRLSRLTACVQAANSLIFPMYWQHIFIPVLPNHLLDYLNAPMPFLIGVPAVTMSRVKKHELGDVVLLDADENKIETPFDDIHMLPTEIISFLKRSLKPPNNLLGDALARTFLKALVMLIGGYRDALSFPPGEKITFNSESFITSRAAPLQPFLEKMLQLQIFQQFIEGRLHMLSEGEGFNDEFEFEVNMYSDKNTHRLKTQYKEWLSGIKKEGSAILKSVNPAMKLAYKQVRDKGKQARDKTKRAYKDLRHKLGDKAPSNRPRSAPSSPNTSPTQNRRMYKLHENSVKKSASGIFGNSSDVHEPTSERTPKNIIGKVTLRPKTTAVSDLISVSEDNLNFEPLNMNLMDDLADVMLRRCSITSPELASLAMQTSNVQKRDAAPLMPPPRVPSLNEKQMHTSRSDNLIQLESPPDDLTTIFDPLASRKIFTNGQNSSKNQDGFSTTVTPFQSSLSSSNQRLSSKDSTIPLQNFNSTNIASFNGQPSTSVSFNPFASDGFAMSSNPFGTTTTVTSTMNGASNKLSLDTGFASVSPTNQRVLQTAQFFDSLNGSSTTSAFPVTFSSSSVEPNSSPNGGMLDMKPGHVKTTSDWYGHLNGSLNKSELNESSEKRSTWQQFDV